MRAPKSAFDRALLAFDNEWRGAYHAVGGENVQRLLTRDYLGDDENRWSERLGELLADMNAGQRVLFP